MFKIISEDSVRDLYKHACSGDCREFLFEDPTRMNSTHPSNTISTPFVLKLLFCNAHI